MIYGYSLCLDFLRNADSYEDSLPWNPRYICGYYMLLVTFRGTTVVLKFHLIHIARFCWFDLTIAFFIIMNPIPIFWSLLSLLQFIFLAAYHLFAICLFSWHLILFPSFFPFLIPSIFEVLRTKPRTLLLLRSTCLHVHLIINFLYSHFQPTLKYKENQSG